MEIYIITQRNVELYILIDTNWLNVLQNIKNIALKLSLLLDRNPQTNINSINF